MRTRRDFVHASTSLCRQGRVDAQTRVGRRARDTADRPHRLGDLLGEDAQDLGEGRADRLGRVGRTPVSLEHGHDEAERLGGREHQRRESQASADAVAAVRAGDRLDGQVGLAEDGDVAAGGALGDAQVVAEPLRGDAGAVLDGFEGEERPRRGTRVVPHTCHLPDADRPGRRYRSAVTAGGTRTRSHGDAIGMVHGAEAAPRAHSATRHGAATQEGA